MPSAKGNRGQGAPTPTRPVRVDLDVWDQFGEATKRQETDRSEAIRGFMAWYTRQPGAKMPQRPSAEG